MSRFSKLLPTLLLAPVTLIHTNPECKINDTIYESNEKNPSAILDVSETPEDNITDFIKNLSAYDLAVYENVKKEKGLAQTLQLLNSPSYQLFKLCQNNYCSPHSICQKTLELLNQGADPNFSCNDLSLIRLSSINGHEEIVNLLLERGAIPTDDDIQAITLKLDILATCRENEILAQDDSYPGVSFEYDKQKLLNIQSTLQAKLKEHIPLIVITKPKD